MSRVGSRQDWTCPVAVNLSMRNLHDEDFPDLVAERLSRSGIRPQSLVIEITESSLMADPDRAPQIIRRLNDPGAGSPLTISGRVTRR